MTDFDAATALLLLSGHMPHTIDSVNNNHHSAAKENVVPLSLGANTAFGAMLPLTMAVPPATDRSAAAQQAMPVVVGDLTLQQNVLRPSAIDKSALSMFRLAFSLSAEQELARRIGGKLDAVKPQQPELASPEPRWDDSRTSSPIMPPIGQQPSRVDESDPETERIHHPMMLYANSPGMNGFAMQLQRQQHQRHNYSSSPESHVEVMAAGSRYGPSRRKLVHPQRKSAGISMIQAEELSPSDSGNSSIHDEILQSGLLIQAWTRGNDISEGLPPRVKRELQSILQMSLFNKEFYTKEKMSEFPMEVGYHPNKSRLRKEYLNDLEAADRAKNNLASRRSRHKKKMVNQLMNISLEFDRSENRHLYLQERWLTSLIYELEDKAMQKGVDAYMLRKLRADCGFQ
ncbi:uncharacterized protein LOC131208993 [Anopheles bellator]|uniref:uncharacterized protein LOC131208993 n=1 Tax=Anopheles bellator TaxID=139047 RepID=UPI002649A7F3|nr:uncharacterized protein LOC131208993 [Anopheles bellator]